MSDKDNDLKKNAAESYDKSDFLNSSNFEEHRPEPTGYDFDDCGFVKFSKQEHSNSDNDSLNISDDLENIRCHETCSQSESQSSQDINLKLFEDALLKYKNSGEDDCSSLLEIKSLLPTIVPKEIRPKLWCTVLDIDKLAITANFSYKAHLDDVREQLVDYGVSEYSGLTALDTLADCTENLEKPGHIRLEFLRQIFLDLERTYPTHKLFMGSTGEAKEGRASLFRILAVYARYNPTVSYCQGMSYLAGLLLMQMSEVESFWCLVALMERPKYLSGYFLKSMYRIRNHSEVFFRLLNKNNPDLCEHLDSIGVQPLMYLTPWLMCVFTSLPCWHSVLAVWDLFIIDGVKALFRVGLALLSLMKDDLFKVTDLCHALPFLLRLPVHLTNVNLLAPAIDSIVIEDWEIPHYLEQIHHESVAHQKRKRSSSDLFEDSPDTVKFKSKKQKTEAVLNEQTFLQKFMSTLIGTTSLAQKWRSTLTRNPSSRFKRKSSIRRSKSFVKDPSPAKSPSTKMPFENPPKFNFFSKSNIENEKQLRSVLSPDKENQTPNRKLLRRSARVTKRPCINDLSPVNCQDCVKNTSLREFSSSTPVRSLLQEKRRRDSTNIIPLPLKNRHAQVKRSPVSSS